MTLLEILKSRFEVKETGDENEVRICCPQCSDVKYHLYISLVKRVAFCHRCNSVVSLSKLLFNKPRILSNLSTSRTTGYKANYKAAKVVELKAGIKVSSRTEGRLTKIELPPNMVPAWRSDAKDYMLQRGFDEHDVVKYKLGYCKEGRFAHRIIIPIELFDELRGFVARSVTDATPKYLYSKGLRKARVLFGFRPHVLKYHMLILVEGVFDAMRAGYLAVALLGSYLSDGQTDLLLRGLSEGTRVVIMLDSDARSRAVTIAEKLSSYFDTRVALLDRGDPCDYSRKELLSAVNTAAPYSLHLYKEFLV